jgi:hypothetical protein
MMSGRDTIRYEPPRGALAREERRERVASLHVQGCSVRQIAAELTREMGVSVSPSAVERDLKVIKQRFREVLKEPAEDLYVRGVAMIDLVDRELWRTYSGISDPDPGKPFNPDSPAGLRRGYLQLACLQAILKVVEKRARLAQAFGLVVQQPKTVDATEVDAFFQKLMDRLSPKTRAEFVAAFRSLRDDDPDSVNGLLIP